MNLKRLGWTAGLLACLHGITLPAASAQAPEPLRSQTTAATPSDAGAAVPDSAPQDGCPTAGCCDTGCGRATSAVGPFYCPADEGAYIDLDFFAELENRFGAPGQFAQAYVIAHEVGHHVQNILGLSEQVHRAPQSQQQGADGLSVRLELQADCFAGLWAHSVFGPGSDVEITEQDVRDALAAAEAIGDDRLQEQAGVDVNPETWSHGSSDQRVEWFNRGFEGGQIALCDTFSSEL